MDRVCAACGETLPPSAFYATGIQRSCKACVARGKRRSARRFRQRHSVAHRRQQRLRTALAIPVRGVIEAGHDDRCIVWEPGPMGFCAYVTVAFCPCDTHAEFGTCAHQRLATTLLDGKRERGAA